MLHVMPSISVAGPLNEAEPRGSVWFTEVVRESETAMCNNYSNALVASVANCEGIAECGSAVVDSRLYRRVAGTQFSNWSGAAHESGFVLPSRPGCHSSVRTKRLWRGGIYSWARPALTA